VDDPLLVGGLEGLGNLRRDRERFVERDRPLGDAIGQSRTLDELEDESLLAIRPFGVSKTPRSSTSVGTVSVPFRR